jgi:hypothetical protein
MLFASNTNISLRKNEMEINQNDQPVNMGH